MTKQKPVSGDSSLLKSINQTTLLELIRQLYPISRADLAKRTKLTRATVSALVEDLIARHLVVETGIGESSGGRRPMMLEINREAGYVFGVDLRATDMLVICANLRGECIRETRYDYDNPEDSEKTLGQLIETIRNERRELPESPLGLCGVGIGIHGFVEHPGQQLVFVPHFGWRGLHWKEKLEAAFGAPVWLDNEANLAALGELESGAAAGCTDMVYISVGAGIGAGIIVGGDVFRGNGGYAGEIGHTTIERNGLPCKCGNSGCWELYASEKALAALAGMPYAPGVTERMLDRLRLGDGKAIDALNEVGDCLAIGVGNMIHTFNPEVVVIGNALAAYSEWLSKPVERTLVTRYPFRHVQSVDIRYSGLGENAAALGAAFMGIRNMMKR